MRNGDPSRRQHVFNHPQAERKTEIQPNGMSNDFGGRENDGGGKEGLGQSWPSIPH